MSEEESGQGLERLAYELSLHALGQQEGTLSELRARTGVLIAATSIVASFLGARAAESGRAWLNVLALVAFVVSILASGYVLIPNKGFVFSLQGSALLEAEEDDPEGLNETCRRLAYWLDGYRRANGEKIGRLMLAFGVGAVALVFEAILWMVDLFL